MNKYNATKVKVENELFDSTLEFNTWQVLTDFTKISNITRQYPLQVIPESHYFKPVHYFVDFAIHIPQTKKEFFIEAKGVATNDWMLKYKLLWHYYPEIAKKLFVVCHHNSIRKLNRQLRASSQIIPLNNFPLFLKDYLQP